MGRSSNINVDPEPGNRNSCLGVATRRWRLPRARVCVAPFCECSRLILEGDAKVHIAVGSEMLDDLGGCSEIVRGVRACFDARELDPEAAPLYDAAAAYLCALWIDEVPAGRELDDLRAGRETPD